MSQNWNKTYSRINWENRPNSSTALGATNLNKEDKAINEIDNRVIRLDEVKLDKSVANGMVKDITLNQTNGIITITFLDGTTRKYDTKLEKIAVNFTYDAQSQQLVITLDDETKQYIDLSSLITEYEFKDSDTVSFSVTSGKVSAKLKDGSVTESKLQPNYLADVKVQSQIATRGAENAEDSANNAYLNEKLAQSYAVGGTGIREGEDTDNARYYSQNSDARNKEPLLTETKAAQTFQIKPSYEGRAELTDLVHNLLSYPYSEITKTINGVTYTDNGDGSISVVGNNTVQETIQYFVLKSFSNLSNGKYNFSGGNTSVNLRVYLREKSSATFSYPLIDNGDGITFEVTDDIDTVLLRIHPKMNVDVNCVIYPMLVKGTESKPFVPPMGYDIVSCGTNMYDISKAENIVVNSNGSIIITDNYKTSDFIPIDPQNNYTVSAIKNGSSAWIRFCLYDKNKNFVRRTDTASFPRTVQFSDAYYVRLCYENTADNYFNDVQFEFGAQSSPYENFQGDSVTITKDTEKAYIKTYDGQTNIISPVDVTAKYAISENGKSVMEDIENSVDGSDILLTDCLDGKCEVSGLVHNELPYPYYNTTVTRQGITFTDNGDGTITLNGTAINNVYFYFTDNKEGYSNKKLVELFAKNDITLKGGTNKVSLYYYNRNKSYQDTGNGRFVPKQVGVTNGHVGLHIVSGSTFDNETIKPMLVKGTEPKPFVPPMGYDIVSRGRNLFDKFNTENTAYGTVTQIPNGISVTGTYYVKNVIKVKPNTNYSFGYLATKKTDEATALVVVYSPDLKNEIIRNNTGHLIFNSNNYTEIVLLLYSGVGALNTTEYTNIQLELGTEATPYEPYREPNIVKVTKDVDKVYLDTYKDYTNIFTEYDVDLHVAYGVTEKANDRFLAEYSYDEIKNMYDKFYPVGSLYMNESNEVDPSKTFGGTWELLQDRFLSYYIWKKIS